jgi:hypothetical protein
MRAALGLHGFAGFLAANSGRETDLGRCAKQIWRLPAKVEDLAGVRPDVGCVGKARHNLVKNKTILAVADQV